MASIAEIRQQYPQYDDLSDQALADAIYAKSYSDMPRADFDAKIGLPPAAKPGTKEYANWALKQALAGNKVPQVSQTPPEYEAPKLNTPVDQVMAGYTSAVNAIPIAGPSIMGKLNEAKGALQGRDPAEIAAENATVEQANPIASGAGMVAGTVLPFMAGGMIPGVGRALGMTGGLTSRVGFGALSGAAIGAADTKARGGSNEEATVSAGIGGALGGALPLAARGLQKVFTPTVAPRATTQAANVLRNEGVDLTAGQRTGSKKLKYLESELGGATADALAERQGRQFTAAVMRRAGINADSAEPQVIDQAFGQIGQQFDDLAARNTLVADRHLLQDVGQALRDYSQNVAQSQQAPVVRNLVGDIVAQAQANGGQLTGEFYKATRSRIDRLARSTTDPELKMALRDIVGALDQGMERSISAANPGDLGAWRQVRRQYANMLVIEKAATGAGEQAASGIITPARLRSAAIGQNRRAFARGRNEFVDLANAGVQAMTPLPQSGTAPRLAARGFAAIPASVGAAIGAPGGIPGMIAGAAAGAAVPWAAGRAVLSGPGRALLSNQVFAQMPRGFIAPATGGLLADQR
jgi:hypothetical protein